MDKSIMPAFRLVGAQLRTLKYDLGKSRPKGSAPLLPEQTFFRHQARALYEVATAKFAIAEGSIFGNTPELPREDLCDLLREANAYAIRAQEDWRRVHPSNDVPLKPVTFEDRRYVDHIDGNPTDNTIANLRVLNYESRGVVLI